MGLIESAVSSALHSILVWYAHHKPLALSVVAVVVAVVVAGFWACVSLQPSTPQGTKVPACHARPCLILFIQNLPPVVKYAIPFIGNAIEYGIDPVSFLQKCQKEHGDCFTFLMLGRKMTFTLGQDGNYFLFNVKIKDATAEGAYHKLTVPVFGKEVVFDVPNALFMEQKRFLKDGLSTAALTSYLPIITTEVKGYLAELFPSLEPGQEVEFDTFEAMSELIIRTAAHCLMGKEIRDVTKLYHDLNAGFAPINVFFRWLPLPEYIARDRANHKMTEWFKSIIKKRIAENDTNTLDILNALMRAEYKDGSKPSDDAIAHLMIALLLGGQHTSSTTSSWMLFELARCPDV
ncbi:Lanosterol 14-alpha-demethylase, partial [Entophlyctis luteolus]